MDAPQFVQSRDSQAENDLWVKFKNKGHANDRNALIERYLPLSRMIAGSLYKRRISDDVDFSDYMQYATMGLIESIDRFDPSREASFETFAAYRIQGAILNGIPHFTERQAQLSLKSRLREERVKSITRERRSGRAASSEAFAELAEIAVGLALLFLLEDSGMVRPEEASEHGADIYGHYEFKQMLALLEELVEMLPERERLVVKYHYYQDITFVQIADLLGVTKGRVSQIHHNAVSLLKSKFDGKKLDMVL